MGIQADAVAVGRALIAALLFVGERAASFSEAKFDDTKFGSVLGRRRTHWLNCKERGLLPAVQLAGPFIRSSQGHHRSQQPPPLTKIATKAE